MVCLSNLIMLKIIFYQSFNLGVPLNRILGSVQKNNENASRRKLTILRKAA